MPRYCLVILALAALAWATSIPAADKTQTPKFPLLFEDHFEKGADHWEPKDPKGWKVVKKDTGYVYSQFEKNSDYKPPFRSPFHIALVKGLKVGDFVLDAKVKSTIKDYPHRDACLFFGYQDPAHFYYVHFGKKTDDNANQIFIVNNAPRTKISTKTTPGTPWTDDWHHVRIVRTVEDGKIAVFFDDMKTAAMTAADRTFTWGQVGVGSFDDTTDWADVKIHGVRVQTK